MLSGSGEYSFLIYKVVNNIDGKLYIGYTTRGLKNRMMAHYRTAFNPNSNSYRTYFYRALRKTGMENFTWDILEEGKGNKNLIFDRELYWKLYYNSTNSDFGYNMVLKEYGTIGYKHREEDKEKMRKPKSEEHRQKNSMNKKGNKYWVGKHHTSDSIEKIRLSKFGTTASPETKKKMSELRSGNRYGIQNLRPRERIIFIIDGKKKCSICGVEKIVEEFGKDKNQRSGYTCACRSCINLSARKKYNPEKQKIKWNKYYYSK
jgi:group I intron endonuclease